MSRVENSIVTIDCCRRSHTLSFERIFVRGIFPTERSNPVVDNNQCARVSSPGGGVTRLTRQFCYRYREFEFTSPAVSLLNPGLQAIFLPPLNAWRAALGWAKDDLVRKGIVAKKEKSGRGLWWPTGKEFTSKEFSHGLV